jgi:hypothetical protein
VDVPDNSSIYFYFYTSIKKTKNAENNNFGGLAIPLLCGTHDFASPPYDGFALSTDLIIAHQHKITSKLLHQKLEKVTAV